MVSIFYILSWRTNSSALYYAQILTNTNNIWVTFFEWFPPDELIFYLTHFLTLYLAFHPTYILTFYMAFYLTYILTFYLAFFAAFYLTSCAVEVQQCPLTSGAPWGPAVPTEIWSSRLKSGSACCLGETEGFLNHSAPARSFSWRNRDAHDICKDFSTNHGWSVSLGPP